MIGYIGCSNSAMSVKGYHDIGGNQFWPPTPNYNAGTIPYWVTDPKYWVAFEGLKALYGAPDKVWIEVCLRANERTNTVIGNAVTVIRDLRQRVPNVNVYCSALQPYPDHVCSITGIDGPARSQEVIDWLLKKHMCLPGPIMPGLKTSQCLSDGCHPNPEGQKLLGQALLDFFG
jgi:hypothetical protein